MRVPVLVLAAVFGAGVAHANPYDSPDYRAADYAATAYYRVDFGAVGGAGARQVLGLRMASERADAQGAPALLKAEWTPSGALSALAISGLPLRRNLLAHAANGLSEDSLLATEEADAACTGIGQPRADCVREGWKRSVRKAGWFSSMVKDLSLPEIITAAAAIGIVVAGAYSAGKDEGSNTGAGP